MWGHVSESFHLAEVSVPLDPTAPWGAVWDGIRECSVADHLDRYGYDDLADDHTAGDLVRYGKQDERIKVWLVALRGPRPEGTPDGRFPGLRAVPSEPGPDVVDSADVLAESFVSATLPDNTHLLETSPAQLRPTDRGRGIEEAMLALHDGIARALDRSTLLGWVSHRGAQAEPASDGSTILDPRGVIALRRDDPFVALQLAAGYSFAQAERHSMQPIPVAPERLLPALDRTRAEAVGYEVLQWTGLSPAEHLDDLAILGTAMSTDPPLGEVDWRPEVWDAERFRRMEERAIVDGTFATTVVRHRSTGRLVGLTQLLASSIKHQVAYQWSTIVLDGHRGHGLGLLLKAENSRLLAEAFPAVRRVHTWNADENDRMLAVNVALGYLMEGIDGCWQKKL